MNGGRESKKDGWIKEEWRIREIKRGLEGLSNRERNGGMIRGVCHLGTQY